MHRLTLKKGNVDEGTEFLSFNDLPKWKKFQCTVHAGKKWIGALWYENTLVLEGAQNFCPYFFIKLDMGTYFKHSDFEYWRKKSVKHGST